MKLTSVQRDRAVGALMGLATGDALGAGLEFKPSLPYTSPLEMVGGGIWARGEWTDDTAMAIGIAQVAASGKDLISGNAQDEIATNWLEWAKHTKDIGIQTRSVFALCDADPTSANMRASAKAVHHANGRSAGNGSLMRTAPVALSYLGDNEKISVAARAISELTHFEDTAGDACVIWCLAISHCIIEGALPDLRDFVVYLPEDRRDYWLNVIDEAEANESHSFPNNGWVVTALQAAWSAIVHAEIPADRPDLRLFPAQHFAIALERAVRCGGDTDTVGAIAGQILGALWGSSAIPLQWRRFLHGYPNLGQRDLVALAVLCTSGGKSDPVGWPTIDVVDDTSWAEYGTKHLLANNQMIACGGHGVLHEPPFEMQAAISLCRTGTSETSLPSQDHLQLMVMDLTGPQENLNLAFVFDQAAIAVETFIAEGKKTVVHCVQAQSRTPSTLIAYLMNTQSLSFTDALIEVRKTLPKANPNNDFVVALKSLEHNFELPAGEHRTKKSGFYQLLSQGTFSYLVESEKATQIKFEGPFGVLYRSGGAWVEKPPKEVIFVNSQSLELNPENSAQATQLIRECDQAQFNS